MFLTQGSLESYSYNYPSNQIYSFINIKRAAQAVSIEDKKILKYY